MSSPDLLEHPSLDISSERAGEILRDLYGLSGVVSPLPGDRDTNFLVESKDRKFMLKVANPREDPEALQARQAVLNHVRLWDPKVTVPKPVATRDGRLVAVIEEHGDSTGVCLTTYLAGATIEETGWTKALRLDVTAMLARLGLALRAFHDERLLSGLLWDLGRLQELLPHTVHLPARRRGFADGWLNHFSIDVAERVKAVRHQTIHADFNPANLIVDPVHPDRLAGVIDFGDMTYGPLVADPAIAIAYQCLDATDPAAVIIGSAAQYHLTVPLTRREAALIPELAITRLVQSLIISSWRASIHRDNRDYILIHAEPVWSALEKLGHLSLAELSAAVQLACGYEAGSESIQPVAAVSRRQSSLGPGLRLSYDEPLHAASAEGVWITDTAGNRHLDAYNNVAHVGHGRAEVVNAIARQAARLNTNTRYVVDEVTGYAERIAALLPDPLQVVYFANSGGEANDLAWRMARTVTARRGIVVTDHAYHGSTYLTMATSPEELGLANIEQWVATVAPPSAASTEHGMGRALERLSSLGERLAAFACDTVFSSDGIYEPPAGYLAATYAAVRAAGGLCIADEVQAGFGRVGERFWGFAGHGVVPDIVTLGKPMGNGHPIAAVVTTREIADEFAKSGYYFSTFAGNPVSTAAGQAVLDVIERERLPQNADDLGEYLRDGLRLIAASQGDIVDVRGPGLFIGVEMTDARRAAAVQNGMRRNRVLIGRTGPGGNVLKIRPPLVFEEHHADILLAALDRVLGG